MDYLGLEMPKTTDELEKVLIAFRDHANELQQEFDITGGVIPMSFIINNGDQDPAILMRSTTITTKFHLQITGYPQ